MLPKELQKKVDAYKKAMGKIINDTLSKTGVPANPASHGGGGTPKKKSKVK